MAVRFFSTSPCGSPLSDPKPFRDPPPSFLPPSSNLHRRFSHPARISRPLSLLSLRISHHTVLAPKCTFHSSTAARLEDNNPEMPSESEPQTPLTEATFDIKLPRRSLLVQFTCNACGERTRRLINRVAYERGTVFVQCAGCLQHHKLIDNLGLIVEYDFREDADSNANQV